MLRLLIYGYMTGVRSYRAIERKRVDDVGFRFLAADQAPAFRSIARFRRRHLDALAKLFLQSPAAACVLRDVRCESEGVVAGGDVVELFGAHGVGVTLVVSRVAVVLSRWCSRCRLFAGMDVPGRSLLISPRVLG